MTIFKNPEKSLILGTSTDVGKTFFVTEILRLNPNKFKAIKPIVSGFDENCDTFKIIEALNIEKNQQNIEKISPFRLKYPFSPLKAAKMEQKSLNFDKIVNFCQKNIENSENLLIEGAGGVMTPINDDKTFLDLANSLKIPVILVGNVYLGAISQILCAFEALKSRQIEINSIIINDFSAKNDLSGQDILQEVHNFSKTPCFLLDKALKK
jgi:dethiobiotin synthetase